MLPPSDECPMNWFFIQSELNGYVQIALAVLKCAGIQGGRLIFGVPFLEGHNNPNSQGSAG